LVPVAPSAKIQSRCAISVKKAFDIVIFTFCLCWRSVATFRVQRQCRIFHNRYEFNDQCNYDYSAS
jgi:hypothetical protein